MNEETPAPVPAPENATDATTPAPAAAEATPAKPTLRLASKPMGADKPLTNQQISSAVKMPTYARQFASPMPKLDEAHESVPAWQAAVAALAAVAAVGSAVMLYLKV